MKIRAGVLIAVMLAASGMAAPVLASTTPAQAAPEDQADTLVMMSLFKSGYEKLTTGKFGEARADFEALVKLPVFKTRPVDAQFGAYVLLAQCQLAQNDAEAAYGSLVAGGKIAPDQRDGFYWFSFATAAAATNRTVEAVDAFTTIARTDPASLTKFGKFSDDAIREITAAAYTLKDDRAHFTALAEALLAADYHPSNPLISTEPMRFHLFETYMAHGQEDKAAAFVPGFYEPNSLIGLRADKRYQRFVAQGPGGGDFVKAQNDDIAAKRKLADSLPASLEAQNSLASTLVFASRPDEALKVVDAAEARIKAAPAGKPAFDDQAEQMNWLAMMRSEALKQLPGSNVEDKAKAIAAAQIQADALVDEKGGDVVSQKINLAEVFYQNGENQKAIDTLARLDLTRASPYGKMAAQEAWVCGYAGLGDKANMTKALDYMKDHAADSPRLLRSALLCAGDLDGLAKLLIANLDDPVTRNATLVQLQSYTGTRNAGAFAEDQYRKAKLVGARPDVQAAIAKYGVVESYPATLSQY